MELTEVRSYPDKDNYRLVSTNVNGNEFCYYNDGQHESFEVYLYKAGQDQHYYSRCYKIGTDIIPFKYDHIVGFLKEEFNKQNWDFHGSKYPSRR